MAVCAFSGCGTTARAGKTTSEDRLTIAALDSAFQAKNIQLAGPSWHRFGPVKRVQYLDWWHSGRVATTPAGMLSVRPAFGFTVLVFSTAAEARSAFGAARDYLRRSRTPAIRRANVVLAARRPVTSTNIAVWNRAEAALRSA